MSKLQLKGSESRDLFKQLHKLQLSSRFYACDVDLELVEKKPKPFIVARLDFKLPNDRITFSEVLSYNTMLGMGIPVYVIEAASIRFTACPPEQHRFNVLEYKGGDHKPEPPEVKMKTRHSNLTWCELGKWERKLRVRRKQEIKKAT